MTEWLTYAQIGERFGLGAEAARTRVRRAGWRTQPGNDGRTLVMLPDDVDLRPGGVRAAGPAGAHADDRAETAPETAMTGLLAGALAALEDSVAALREQLDTANARAERAEADRADERRHADDLRAQIAGLTAEMALVRAGLEADRDAARTQVNEATLDAEVMRGHLALAQAALEQAQADARAARSAAEVLRQAETAREAQGLLARLKAAWRGR